MSKNVTGLLHSVRNHLALLCPETDGLQAKHRMVYIPEGTTLKEQEADIVNYVYEKFFSWLEDGKECISQLDARRISLILRVDGFSQKEVFRILYREHRKRK